MTELTKEDMTEADKRTEHRYFNKARTAHVQLRPMRYWMSQYLENLEEWHPELLADLKARGVLKDRLHEVGQRMMAHELEVMKSLMIQEGAMTPEGVYLPEPVMHDIMIVIRTQKTGSLMTDEYFMYNVLIPDNQSE
jgi:hypothetical protein